MTLDRFVIKKRVNDVIINGFGTHRILNKIFHESLSELADAICDEIEKEFKVNEGLKAEEANDAGPKRRINASPTNAARQ